MCSLLKPFGRSQSQNLAGLSPKILAFASPKSSFLLVFEASGSSRCFWVWSWGDLARWAVRNRSSFGLFFVRMLALTCPSVELCQRGLDLVHCKCSFSRSYVAGSRWKPLRRRREGVRCRVSSTQNGILLPILLKFWWFVGFRVSLECGCWWFGLRSWRTGDGIGFCCWTGGIWFRSDFGCFLVGSGFWRSPEAKQQSEIGENLRVLDVYFKA